MFIGKSLKHCPKSYPPCICSDAQMPSWYLPAVFSRDLGAAPFPVQLTQAHWHSRVTAVTWAESLLGHQWHCSYVLFPALWALETSKAAGQTREAERAGHLLTAGLSSLDAVRTTFEKMAMREVQLLIHFLCSNTYDSRFAEASQWECLCSENKHPAIPKATPLWPTGACYFIKLKKLEKVVKL